MKVCGVEVESTPTTINALFWDEPVETAIVYAQKVATKSDQFQWVASIICVGLQLWYTEEKKISWQDLYFEAKVWLDFICSRIMPSKNNQRVPHKVAILIVCSMKDIYINFGQIVAVQM